MNYVSRAARRAAHVMIAVVALGLVNSCVRALRSDETALLLDERQRFVDALARAGVIGPPRLLVHLSHTCDLAIEGATYRVLDVRWVLPGMQSTHGVNKIVVLDAALHEVWSVTYYHERPLNCYGSRLLLFGVLDVESAEEPSSGDLIIFSHDGRPVRAVKMNWDNLPDDLAERLDAGQLDFGEKLDAGQL